MSKAVCGPNFFKQSISTQQADVSIVNCLSNMTPSLTTLCLSFLLTLVLLSHTEYFVPDTHFVSIALKLTLFFSCFFNYNSCICLSWMKALPAMKYLNKFFTVKCIVINKLKHNKKISYLHRIFVISSFYFSVLLVKIKILGPKVCMIYQSIKEKTLLPLILQWSRMRFFHPHTKMHFMWQ